MSTTPRSLEKRTPLPPEWRALIRTVPVLSDAERWLAMLSDGLQNVIRPDAAAVYLSSLDDVHTATFAVAPAREAVLAQQLLERVLPGLRAAGLETPDEWFARGEGSNRRREQLLSDCLVPLGYRGLLGGALRSSDGMIAGWIAVFSRSPESERLVQIGEPLRAFCTAAELTIQSALALAEKVGARLPKASPRVLSAREREIARLAVRGYSDLNIAERLRISESTVGRHLHNIYRKLSVCSRLELSSIFVPAFSMTSDR